MVSPAVVSGLKAYRQVLGMATAVLLVASGVSVTRTVSPTAEQIAGPGQGGGAARSPTVDRLTAEQLDEHGNPLGAGTERSNAEIRIGAPGADVPGTVVPGVGTVPPGVTDKEIKVVYYWKGDRTTASPYLHGTGQEGSVDEAESFRHLVAYVNKYADGGATFMGLPFNLQGRKLKIEEIVEAGQYPVTYAAAAEHIAKTLQPFVAISSHGSLSAYICPRLAQAGIHNLATINMAPGLVQSTNGYCRPQGPSWEAQVEWSVNYLAKHNATTKYQSTTGPQDRVYGLLYAEYPGLVDSAPVVADLLRNAGLKVHVESMAADLTTAQQQAPSRVARFRNAGVNTMVMPDGGAPINFTHAAQANGYNPDYYIWPCSGQDTAGMVRLFNAAQWTRASGLSCYDPEFTPDLTNDSQARSTEWYRQYQEVAGSGNEPPAPTPLVYAALLPLVAGVTNAGPNLTVESFRNGLAAFDPYRYSAVRGKTDDPTSLLLTPGARDGSFSSDVARIYWSATTRKQGNATTGAYIFPEDRRHGRGSSF